MKEKCNLHNAQLSDSKEAQGICDFCFTGQRTETAKVAEKLEFFHITTNGRLATSCCC
jgi:hypothetical protein